MNHGEPISSLFSAWFIVLLAGGKRALYLPDLFRGVAFRAWSRLEMLVMPPSSQGDEHPQPAAEAILVSRFWPIPIESHTIPCQKKLSPVSSRIWKRVLEISLNQGESWLLHAQDVAAAVPNDFSIKQCCGKADILAAGTASPATWRFRSRSQEPTPSMSK